MKYLSLYKKWMKTGELPHPGLCNTFGTFFNPDHPLHLFHEMNGYWGFNGDSVDEDDEEFEEDMNMVKYGFTPLRQTIVLFLAAMNNEL